MKRIEFTINTKANIEIIDITAKVNNFLKDNIRVMGVRELFPG